MIDAEDELQTPAIVNQVQKLDKIGRELCAYLEKLDPRSRNGVTSAAHQFFRGDKDEKALAEIMKKIDDAKRTMCLKIQVANVGLAKSIADKLVANTEVIERIDHTLVNILGEDHGLRIAKLIKTVNVGGESSSESPRQLQMSKPFQMMVLSPFQKPSWHPLPSKESLSPPLPRHHRFQLRCLQGPIELSALSVTILPRILGSRSMLLLEKIDGVR